MKKDDHLQPYLDLCQRIYERMKREGTWPWREGSESPNPGDVVESEDITDDA